jgi:GAF domain-containing protein
MLKRYISTVQELSKALVIGQTMDTWIEVLCRLLTENIGTARASVWKYEGDTEEIICLTLFDRTKNEFTRGFKLNEKNFPDYFKELRQERIIDAEHAITDSRTSEFAETYLKPLGIVSMLDTPIFLDGTLFGVICLESLEQKSWSLEEQMLVRSMADLCSLAFVQHQLQEALHTIEKQKQNIEEMNGTLEARVHERTKELEKQNELLIEYSFINSHLLRGPICTIRGLVSLLEMEDLKNEHPAYIKKIQSPIDQLSALSDKMNSVLTRGLHLNREDLRQDTNF